MIEPDRAMEQLREKLGPHEHYFIAAFLTRQQQAQLFKVIICSSRESA